MFPVPTNKLIPVAVENLKFVVVKSEMFPVAVVNFKFVVVKSFIVPVPADKVMNFILVPVKLLTVALFKKTSPPEKPATLICVVPVIVVKNAVVPVKVVALKFVAVKSKTLPVPNNRLIPVAVENL